MKEDIEVFEAEEALGELERQVERSGMFMHASLDRIVGRVSGTETFVTQLVDLLRSKGILTAEDVGETAPDAGEDTGEDHGEASIAEEEPETSPTPQRITWPSIAFRTAGQDPPPPVAVNCGERMHICHAVCCKLNFALSPEEIDAGKVKWDLGFPYIIRHNAHGYCVHNDMQTGACKAYADRPGVCRSYSCANDSRIWKDFATMELNHEWLDENLVNHNRIRFGTDAPTMLNTPSAELEDEPPA